MKVEANADESGIPEPIACQWDVRLERKREDDMDHTFDYILA